MKGLILVLALSLAFAMTAPAQILSGSLGGSVTDPSGQRIPGATVRLTSEISGEQRTGTTNETGDFFFPGLAPGPYTIHVEAQGFRVLERKNNVVQATGRLVVGNLQLEVGTIAESVTVTAQGQEVATTTTAHTALLDAKQLSLISVRGRDVVSLLRLLPGTQQNVGESYEDQFGGSFGTIVPNFEGGGGQTLYVDGVNGGDGGGGGRFSGATNMDAIAEVNVQMSSYTAEYGLKGGSQVNFITKRGTDQFHGAGYWYERNEAFNATPYFNKLGKDPSGNYKQLYRYRTLGGTISGPVPFSIPIINRGGNKMFFFYSIDDTRSKDPTAIERWTFPTALEKAGDYSQSKDTKGALIVVRDPNNNNTPFSNNVIPSNRGNALSIAMMNILPLPNYTGVCTGGSSGCNFQFQEPSIARSRRQHLFKVDLRPSDKDTISFKDQTWFTHSLGYQVVGRSIMSAWGLAEHRYDFTADQATLQYTRIISPSIVNEFSIGVFYSTEGAPLANAATYASMQKQNRGLGALQQFAPQHNPLNWIPKLAFGSVQTGSVGSGRSGFGSDAAINYDGRSPLIGADTAFPISNNLTYMRGVHTFKFGALRENERFGQSRSGTFAGGFNFQHDSNDPGTTGFAYANAFIGHIREYQESLGRTPNNRYQTTYAFFAQDTWKVRRNLTLDIGVRFYKWNPPLNGGGEASMFSYDRYDPTWGGKPPVLFQPTKTAQGRRAINPLTNEIMPASYIGLIVPGTGYACTDVITASTPCKINGIVTQKDPTYLGGKEGFYDPLPLQWDPRFGLAWDVFGDGKMAIRASVGAYHDGTGGSLSEGGPAFNFTRSILFTDMNSFLTSGGASSVTGVSGVWKKGQKRPVTYNYTFGIQRELGWHTVLDVAYVGKSTHHNNQSWDFNALPAGVRFLAASQDPTSPGKPLPDNFLRPFVGFAGMSISGPATTSRYDSLQAQVNRRFVGGVEIAGAYTYAGGTSNGWRQSNPLPSSTARSRASIQTHVLSISYVVDIPGGSKLTRAPWTKWVLDNWQWSGVTTFSSGNPLNVSGGTSDSFDFTGGGESCGTLVQTGSALVPHGERTWDRWFNTSVFQRPSGRGDIGNNCYNYKFRGPGINNWDMSMFKNFPIREGKTLQFRWEFYNVWNHTQWSAVNSSATFNTAGVQTNAKFGQVTAARQERRMQGSLRFTF